MRIFTLLILMFLLSTCTPKKSYQGLGIYIMAKTEAGISIARKTEIATSRDYWNPFLEETDIEHFDWEKQQIILNPSGKLKIKHLDIPLDGLPVAFKIDGKLIYKFWFWNMISSECSPNVIACPEHNFILKFGLPPNKNLTNDPRFDDRLKKYVLSKYPQTNNGISK